MSNETIVKSLNTNETEIKNRIGESFDTQYRHLKIPAFNNCEALVVYISGLIDSRVIDQTILEALMKYTAPPKGTVFYKNVTFISVLMEHAVFTIAAKEVKQWPEICDAVINGDTVLFIDDCDSALILTTKHYEGRAVSEPNIESEIKGPRDGFVENIQTNASLIRRRIKDPGLRFDNFIIGDRTKTVVSVIYIESLANDALVKEVKSRLGRIKTDSILSSEHIVEYIEDASFSIFRRQTIRKTRQNQQRSFRGQGLHYDG